MKKFVLSLAAASLVASQAVAGSMVVPEPEIAPVVVEEDPGSSASSGGLWIPLLALVAIGLLISQSDDDPEPEPEPEV